MDRKALDSGIGQISQVPALFPQGNIVDLTQVEGVQIEPGEIFLGPIEEVFDFPWKPTTTWEYPAGP
jgi:hypothetical protein